MRSYRPRSSSTATGGSSPELRRARPAGRAAHGREPARERRPLLRRARPARLPPTTRSRSREPATERHESTRQLGELLRDIFTRERRPSELPPLLSGRDELEPARRRLRGREPLLRRDDRCPDDDHVVAGRPRDGGAERAQLPGLARGLPAHRPARPLRHLRGVRDGVGVDGRPAREVARGGASSCRGARRSPRSTSCSPRPAGATTTTASATRARASSTSCSRRRATVARDLPAAGRELPAVGRRPLLPQHELREPDRHRQAAAAAVARHGGRDRALRARRVDLGVGVERRGREPDVVLACAGDIPTLETVAAAWLAAAARAGPARARRQRRRPDDALRARARTRTA